MAVYDKKYFAVEITSQQIEVMESIKGHDEDLAKLREELNSIIEIAVYSQPTTKHGKPATAYFCADPATALQMYVKVYHWWRNVLAKKD